MGQPSLYASFAIPRQVHSETRDSVTLDRESQNPGSQNPETQDSDAVIQVRRSKLMLTPLQWAILVKAQPVYEDSCIFETPFPTPQQDMLARVDAWRSAARQCNVKGTVPDMGEKVNTKVSDTLHTPRYILM